MTTDSSVQVSASAKGGDEIAGLQQVPVQCNVLYPTEAAALLAPRGNVDLVFCSDTGLVFNAAFDADTMEYDVEYENALQHSPRFQRYAEKLAADLVGRYGLHGQRIVEIGCGDGYFLGLLCRAGKNQGLGFDPSLSSARGPAAPGDDITIRREYFYPATLTEPVALVCCRHVLEHLPNPLEFLGELRAAAALEKTTFYFEVPNARFTLQSGGYWDVLYEHCSYFTDLSLTAILHEAGYEVLRCSTAYAGQFLQIEARPRLNGHTESEFALDQMQLCELQTHAERFARTFSETVNRWSNWLAMAAADGKRVALWGAGTKGVMFLNLVDCQRRAAYIVDRNPKKQGCFVAGSGHSIVAPEFLRQSPPDFILLMNSAYEAEVLDQLRGLQVQSELVIA